MSYYDDLRAGDEEMIREWGRPVKLRGKTDPIIAIFNEPYARVDVPHAGFITGTVTSLTALSDDVAGVVARDVVQFQSSAASNLTALLPGLAGPITWLKSLNLMAQGSRIFLEPHTSSENSEYSKY